MKVLHRLLIWLRRARWRPIDIAGCMATLPVLRAQLREVAQQVEQAVLVVCNNFTGMAERSRKAVDRTSELLGGGPQGSDATVEQSIDASRAAISALLDRLERAGQVSAIVVSRMEQVEQASAGIEALLAELQRIAFSNKLVALNAKIEAVHVGELGAGFEVVAGEISRQGDLSNELAEAIGHRVREIRDRVKAAAGDLRVIAAEDREKLAESRQDADGAMNVLRNVHRRARESLTMMVAENAELAREISNAVMGLQFQDRTNQCIAHVVEALETVERSLGGRSAPAVAASARAASDRSLLEDVRDSYTMESERAVLKRSLDEAEGPGAGDVELF